MKFEQKFHAQERIRSLSFLKSFWETHEIWKNLSRGFDKPAYLRSKRQNHEEDFFQIMCASQKVRTLVKIALYRPNPKKILWENSWLKLFTGSRQFWGRGYYFVFTLSFIHRPFNLNLNFWKSRSWEIKVIFKS